MRRDSNFLGNLSYLLVSHYRHRAEHPGFGAGTRESNIEEGSMNIRSSIERLKRVTIHEGSYPCFFEMDGVIRDGMTADARVVSREEFSAATADVPARHVSLIRILIDEPCECRSQKGAGA